MTILNIDFCYLVLKQFVEILFIFLIYFHPFFALTNYLISWNLFLKFLKESIYD